jgi:hypothetical protein
VDSLHGKKPDAGKPRPQEGVRDNKMRRENLPGEKSRRPAQESMRAEEPMSPTRGRNSGVGGGKLFIFIYLH